MIAAAFTNILFLAAQIRRLFYQGCLLLLKKLIFFGCRIAQFDFLKIAEKS